MERSLRKRFWLESWLAVTGGVLLVLTLVWRDWVELVFRVDPDRHSGSMEWLIVAALLAASIGSTFLAFSEWRRVGVNYER